MTITNSIAIYGGFMSVYYLILATLGTLYPPQGVAF